MRNFSLLLIILFIGTVFKINAQCNITPELEGDAIENPSGNSPDYIVVCTDGATTGLLLLQNGISPSFFNAFNSYTINWGDGTTNFQSTQDVFDPAAIHEYAVGNYVLTFSATANNCTVTNEYNVYVGNTPSVSMGSPGGTQGCSEATISFPISNTTNNIPTTTYAVTYSDGSPTENFNQPPPNEVTHTFDDSSCGETFQTLNNSYGVTMVASNECGTAQVTVAPVTISDPPEADFTSTIQTACVGSTVNFDDTSYPGTTATSTSCTSNARFYWTITPASGWTLSSGTLGSNNGFPNNFNAWVTGTDIVGVNFTNAGTYTVSLNYRNGCGPSTHTETICIINPPTCDFDVNNNSGCGPLSVNTDNNTIIPQCGNNNINVNYNWSVVVPTGGSYTVTSGSLTSNSPNFNFTNTTTAPLTYTLNLSATPINPQTGAEMTDCASNCSETITVYPAPVISSHPTPNQTICVGGTPNSLSVSYLYGVGTPSYQWYSNTTNSNTGGTIISGATSATYAPPTLNTAGNYYYYAVISLGGTCGTIISNPAQVTVVPDPTISTQPTTPQTICSGGAASPIQMAYTNGTGTPSYQWFSNTTSSTTGGTPIPGATSASYTPSVPTTPGTYYFYGTVGTSGLGCNTATTNSSSVIVISDPTISLSPIELTLCQNAPSQSITTTVTGGNGSNTYQWFQSNTTSNSNGTIIPNQTGASFTPSTATVGTQYYYVQLTQSTSGCSAVSQIATVNILPAASINVQPLPSTVCVGGVPNTLTATYINGLGTPTYQWYSSTNASGSNPVVINGATSANYVPSTDIVGVVYYFVQISFPSGGCSNISSAPAPVTVIADPTISIQPTNTQEVCVGGAITNPFTSAVSGGTGNLTYQWYSNTTSSNTNGQIISGATSPTYLPGAFSNSGTLYYYATISASGIGCNTSPSNVVSVNILNDPMVSSQPLSTQTVCQNTPTETLSVAITGGIGNVTYTWFSNSSNSTIGGTQVSTSPTFTPPSSSVGTIYYYAIINQTVAGCSVTTTTAAVTVTPTPTITTHPQPSTVCVGGTPTALSVSYINGLGTPSYQWYSSSNSNGSNSTAISGAINDTYAPPSSSAGSLYYFVIISFPNGSCSNITSNTALVNILPDPFISTQPNSPITICQGTSAANAFTVAAQGGTSPLTYQWYSNSTTSTTGGTLIAGANQSTYNPGVINNSGSYYYYVTASSNGNGCESATSNLVTLTVNTAATASVLGPFTTCGNSEIPINSTSSGTGTWSAPAGSGTFANVNNNATTFTPNSSSAQSITLTWTTTDPDGTGPCPAVSANGTLTIFPPATASVSSLTSLCSNATLSLTATSNSPGMWSTNGNGTFSSSTSLMSIYTPSVSDINNSPLNFTWTTQDPDGSGPCISVSSTQTVTVYTPPIVNAGQDQVLCLNSSSITLTATPNGGTWAGNGINSNGSFNPNTLGNFNFTYSFTDINGCTSNDNLTITVNQSAIADANGPYAVCGITPINISATTNGNGTWTGGAGTFANASNASTTYTPAAAEVGTEITLTWETFDPDGSGPCSNAIDNTTLSVSTPAIATPGGPYTICSSDVANIEVTTTPNTGAWSGGAGAFGSSSAASTTYDPATSEAASNVQLTWTTTDPDGSGPCPAVTTNVTVNVLSAAIADANGPYAVCGITPINISATTNGNGIWTGGAGTFANASNASTTYTPTAAEVGTEIILTWETFDPDGTGPCSNAIDNTTLNVSTPATATPGGPYTICSSDVANIEVTTTPNTGAWSGGAGAFGSSSTASTTYDPATSEAGSDVQLTWTTTDPDGSGPCPAVTTNVTVNVLSAAIADANGPYAVCGITPINISATTNGNGTWTGGAGTFANASNASTTYTPTAAEVGTEIILTWETFDPDGTGPCSNAIDNTTLNVSTPAAATPGGPYTICSNGTAQIEVQTSPGDGSWSGGLGTFLNSSNSSTVYEPIASEGGGSVDLLWTTIDPDQTGPCLPVSASVTVFILEEATAEILGPFSTCANSEVTISSSSNGPGEWTYTPSSFGEIINSNSNVTVFQPDVDLFSDNEVTLTWTTFDPDGSGPCTAFSISEILQIESLPVINLNPSFNIDCGDDISAVVTGGEGNYTYQWSPALGVISPTSITTPINASGIFTITATDQNSCSNSASTEVIINALDQMAQSPDVETCLFEPVELTALATLGEAPFSFNWSPASFITPNSGNTATISFTYSQPITIDTNFELVVNITDAFGCSDNEIVNVIVHPLPIVNAGPDLSVCQYEPLFNISGYSPLETTGTGGQWTPSNSVNASSLNIGNNTFSYSFTDLNSCTNQDNMIVVVYEVPVSNFQFPSTVCEGEAVQFTNTSSCGTCGQLTHEWLIGNNLFTSTATNINYTFQDTGFFDIQLISRSSFGCLDTMVQTIHVLALPETAFNMSTNIGCGPLQVDIENISIGSELQYQWNVEPFGTATYFQPGNILMPSAPCDSIFYSVSLSASNLCGTVTVSDSILVYALPQPSFSMSTDSICSENPLELFNNTTCAWQTNYSWDFGDGTSSMSQELLLNQTYFIEGNFASYPITLYAENTCGIVQSTQIITVVPNEITAFFSANPLIGCEPLSVDFDQEMFGVTYFTWDFGDTQTSTIEDPAHIYESDGVFTATFLAGNFCGAQDTATQIIQVLPAPDFNFTSSEQFLCVGESTTFEPFGDAISSYQWNFGDGSSSTLINPSHIYYTEGEFEVTVTGISALNGCPTTVSNTIEVITTPIAEINASDAQGCPPFNVTFTNETVNAINYFWNLGDGNFFIGDSLVHTFNETGNYSVEIIAINDNSCTDTTTVDITVYPSPTAIFTFDTYDYDTTYDVGFYNFSVDAIGYEWNFGDGTNSFFTNPYYSYLKTGECAYVPELVAFNIFGCADTARSIIPIPFLLDVFIPNSFSPNDDGLNDVFTVVTSDVDPYNSHLMIIDRWGVTVHESRGINPSWDGKLKGEPAPNDVYQYIYKGKLKCGLEEFQKVGHLTLIR